MKKKDELDYFNNFVKNANYALESAIILKDYIFNFDSCRVYCHYIFRI